jgi:hypothetical protein
MSATIIPFETRVCSLEEMAEINFGPIADYAAVGKTRRKKTVRDMTACLRAAAELALEIGSLDRAGVTEMFSEASFDDYRGIMAALDEAAEVGKALAEVCKQAKLRMLGAKAATVVSARR